LRSIAGLPIAVEVFVGHGVERKNIRDVIMRLFRGRYRGVPVQYSLTWDWDWQKGVGGASLGASCLGRSALFFLNNATMMGRGGERGRKRDSWIVVRLEGNMCCRWRKV